MISKGFIKSSIIYTVAGAMPMASSIILLPFYTLYLSTDVFGALSVYLGFSLLVQILVTYSFDASVYAYFHEFKKDPVKLNAFISSAFIFILIVGAVTALVLAISGEWIFARVFEKTKILFYPYGMISVATGIFQALFKVKSNLLQTQEKPVTFFWSNLVSFSLIAAITIYGLVLYPDDLIGPIGGRMVATMITGLWVLFTIFQKFGFHFNFALLKTTFGFSQPSLIYQLMQWFNTSFDRVLMSFYLPLSQVGIYDLAMKCLSAIEFALVGFYNSFFPKVISAIAAQKEKGTTVEINRYYNGLTAVTILLVGLCILAFPLAIELFITKPGYLAAIPLIPYIAITYLLRSMRLYAAMPYSATKYSKPLPFFYLIISGVKIGAMVLLVQRYGIQGAIFSTWLSYGVEIFILYYGVRNRFVFKFNAFKLIIAPLSMAILVLLMEPTLGDQFPYPVHAFYVLFSVVILWWAYRNEIKFMDPRMVK